jgi:hypothetical protein
LVFGQVVLVANQQQQQQQQQQEGSTAKAGAPQSRNTSNNNNQDWSLLVTQRNDRALQVLDQTLDSLLPDQRAQTIALLYGCSHCPDLHQGILQRGFTPVQREWRTAWSVPFGSSERPKTTTTVAAESDSSSETTTTLSGTEKVATDTSFGGSEGAVTRLQVASLWVALPVYLVIGGVDWIATLDDVAQSISKTDSLSAVVDTLFYLLRHVLLYVGLSKFVLDWDGSSGGRDESE